MFIKKNTEESNNHAHFNKKKLVGEHAVTLIHVHVSFSLCNYDQLKYSNLWSTNYRSDLPPKFNI